MSLHLFAAFIFQRSTPFISESLCALIAKQRKDNTTWNSLSPWAFFLCCLLYLQFCPFCQWWNFYCPLFVYNLSTLHQWHHFVLPPDPLTYPNSLFQSLIQRFLSSGLSQKVHRKCILPFPPQKKKTTTLTPLASPTALLFLNSLSTLHRIDHNHQLPPSACHWNDLECIKSKGLSSLVTSP